MKMTPLTFAFLLFYTYLATVSGQQSIVSTNTITSGGTFSVYCDASRAATPPGAFSVQTLYIYRMVGTERNYSLIAQYNSLSPPGLSGETRNIPNGRLWNITFSGANNGENNIATMKIVLVVTDAMCSDAGMYRCQIDYYATGETPRVTAPDQNVTASTGLSFVDLTVQPDNQVYYQDDNVTFTCKVTGPATGVSIRWEFWVEDEFGVQQPTNLPSNNEIVNNPAAPQTDSTGCPQFEWVSMLSIQVPADPKQQMYTCIASHMQMEQSSNLTISITGVSGQQSVVSTNTITSGGTFSVFCDSSRAITPSGAYSVQSLFISRMVTTERNYSLIAQYNSVSPPGLTGEIKNIPCGRLWNITFSGANGGVKNIAAMKIVLDVNDAMFSDAGMYRCQIGYDTTTGSTFVTALDQNVTALDQNVTASKQTNHLLERSKINNNSWSGQQSTVSTLSTSTTSGGTLSVYWTLQSTPAFFWLFVISWQVCIL